MQIYCPLRIAKAEGRDTMQASAYYISCLALFPAVRFAFRWQRPTYAYKRSYWIDEKNEVVGVCAAVNDAQ
jgi:hypothetical protein